MAGLNSHDVFEVKDVTTDPDSGADRVRESLFKGGLLSNPPTKGYQKVRRLIR